uniref:Uncharacterized protein n=1 Tax=Juglanconis juglandina TaxID=1940567 RepID=A0A291LJ62_9PEZI|nr:hypothetical protein [Juglanconis juglandina]
MTYFHNTFDFPNLHLVFHGDLFSKLGNIGLDFLLPSISACVVITLLHIDDLILLMDSYISNSIAIERWVPDTIPDDKKNDVFYLKLGFQAANIAAEPNNPRHVYSNSWGRFSLNSKEQWRLNRIADRANRSGALQQIGLAHQYKGRITYANTKIPVKAKADLIMVIRAHDDD